MQRYRTHEPCSRYVKVVSNLQSWRLHRLGVHFSVQYRGCGTDAGVYRSPPLILILHPSCLCSHVQTLWREVSRTLVGVCTLKGLLEMRVHSAVRQEVAQRIRWHFLRRPRLIQDTMVYVYNSSARSFSSSFRVSAVPASDLASSRAIVRSLSRAPNVTIRLASTAGHGRVELTVSLVGGGADI